MSKSLTVFCSASKALDQKYFDQAKEFSELLAKDNYKMVYGGATVGLMGKVADVAKENNCHVTGIIPQVIIEREFKHEGLDELIVTKDMHERKKLLYHHGDHIVILPGGYGTMDEAFESMTWNQLGIHDTPVSFINWFGYYDGIIQYIENAAKEKFTGVYDQFKANFFNSNEEFFNWLKNE